MKKILSQIFISLTIGLCLAAALAVASPVRAQTTDLEIVFEQAPLFAEVNLLPGDTTASRWVRVKNNSSQTTYNLGVKADNITDNNNLAGQFNFKIEDSGAIYFQDSLSDFFSGSVIPLGAIAPGVEKYYYFQADFLPTAGNEFQETALSFDIIMGTTGPTSGGGDNGGTDNTGGDNTGGGGHLLCFLTGTCGSTAKTKNQPEPVVVAGETGAPDLVMQKTVSPSFINPGDKANYQVIIENKGNLSAFNLTLSDNLPAGLVFADSKTGQQSWNLGDLAPGEKKTVSYSVAALTGITPGIYTNVAQARADNHPTIKAKANLEVRPVIVKGISLAAADLAPTGFSWPEFAFLSGLLFALLGLARILKTSHS